MVSGKLTAGSGWSQKSFRLHNSLVHPKKAFVAHYCAIVQQKVGATRPVKSQPDHGCEAKAYEDYLRLIVVVREAREDIFAVAMATC